MKNDNDRCAINFEIFLLDILSCKGAFRNFTKFTGKHLCHSLLSNIIKLLAQAFGRLLLDNVIC